MTAYVEKAQERADKLSEKPRPGENGKKAVKDLNKAQKEGKMECKNFGIEVQNGEQYQRGETPPSNEAHVDQ